MGRPQWTSGSGRGYAGAESGGVTGYASGAGFGVVFTGEQTMQDREKLKSQRGLAFRCSQADTQQQGCYASKV